MINFKLSYLQLEEKESSPLNSEVSESGDSDGQQQLIVSFSAKLVDFLRAKAKDHNKQFPKKKTSLNKLKEIYKRGASATKDSDQAAGQCAMARVNMFLRILSENKILPTSKKRSTESSCELDATEFWAPSEIDSIKASAEIQENDLSYSFTDVNHLYLDEEQTGFSFDV